MNTRKDVEAEGYAISTAGTITSPGKFEGEPWQAVVLYDRHMNGFGEDRGDDVVAFDPDPELFPEDPKATPALEFMDVDCVMFGFLRYATAVLVALALMSAPASAQEVWTAKEVDGGVLYRQAGAAVHPEDTSRSELLAFCSADTLQVLTVTVDGPWELGTDTGAVEVKRTDGEVRELPIVWVAGVGMGSAAVVITPLDEEGRIDQLRLASYIVAVATTYTGDVFQYRFGTAVFRAAGEEGSVCDQLHHRLGG